MRCIGHEFLHHLPDCAELIHEPHLIVEAACGVDDDDIGLARDGGLEGVVGHGGRVGIHALLHNGDAHTVGPQLQLFDGGGTEGVGGTEHYAAACQLVLIGELGDGGGLAHPVDANN